MPRFIEGSARRVLRCHSRKGEGNSRAKLLIVYNYLLASNLEDLAQGRKRARTRSLRQIFFNGQTQILRGTPQRGEQLLLMEIEPQHGRINKRKVLANVR